MSDAEKKSNRDYLKDGAQAFCTGCYLIWDATRKTWKFDGHEDDIYYLGKFVYETSQGIPYTLIDVDKEDDDEDI